MTVVTALPVTPSYVELRFGWGPSGTFQYPGPAGSVVSVPNATFQTVLTFTASVSIDNQGDDISGPLTIVEYYWDFGDGTIGYGNPVKHTYVLANLQATTRLRVTDSKGRNWWTRAQMYLTTGSTPGSAANLPSTINFPSTTNFPRA